MSESVKDELRKAYEWFGKCGVKNSAQSVQSVYVPMTRKEARRFAR